VLGTCSTSCLYINLFNIDILHEVHKILLKVTGVASITCLTVTPSVLSVDKVFILMSLCVLQGG